MRSARLFVAVLVMLSLVCVGCGQLCQQERAAVGGVEQLVDVAETDEQREYAEERLVAAEAALEDCEDGAEDMCQRILLLLMKTALELIETR
jgi:hypothetical protein